jgi:hypothetical protein
MVIIMKITKSTKVPDAIKLSDSILQIFKKYDLYCPRCKGVGEDTIEKVAICNGMDVQIFVDELNSALE